MKAGTELDVLIAEKVMRLDKKFNPTHNKYYYEFDGGCPTCGYNGVYDNGPVPPYSTDIATAWEVINEMNKLSFSRRFKFKDALKIIVSESISDKGLILHESEIILFVEPVHICLAALEAVGK